MKQKIISVAKYIIALSIGLGLFYIIFKDIEFEKIQGYINQVNFGFIFLAFIIGLISHWTRGYRWKIILETNDFKVPAFHTFLAVMVGYMANNAVPRLGEITRCSVLSKSEKIPFVPLAGTVVLERAIDVITLLGLLLLVFTLESKRLLVLIEQYRAQTTGTNSFSYWPFIIIFALLFIAFLFIFRKKLLQNALFRKVLAQIKMLWQSITSITKLKRPIAFVLTSIIIWLGYVLATYVIMLSFPQTANMSIYFAVILTAMGGVGMVLPAPGGVGSFHAAIFYTFVMFNLDQEIGNVLALLLHTPQIIFNSIVGAFAFFYLLAYTKKGKKEVML